jgi:hypothetical protein
MVPYMVCKLLSNNCPPFTSYDTHRCMGYVAPIQRDIQRSNTRQTCATRRYHSPRDKRLPKEFICFHCSLRKDKNWEIIKVQTWYEELLGNFSRLALFRFVNLKISPYIAAVLFSQSGNQNCRDPQARFFECFRKANWCVNNHKCCQLCQKARIECEPIVAAQLFKRLQIEGLNFWEGNRVMS